MTSFPHTIDITDGSLLFVVGSEMDVDLTHRIAEAVRILDRDAARGIHEIIPSYGSILVLYDETVMTALAQSIVLTQAWSEASELSLSATNGTVTIDVVYGDSFGEDLANVSQVTGLSVDDVITLHASSTYTVGAVGFAPGFTYLIGLSPRLATPRRSKPRLIVPAGSVGIGGSQTGVMPCPRRVAGT